VVQAVVWEAVRAAGRRMQGGRCTADGDEARWIVRQVRQDSCLRQAVAVMGVGVALQQTESPDLDFCSDILWPHPPLTEKPVATMC
jgi:hypothetical protein